MKAQPEDDPRMAEQPFDREWWESLDPEYRAELEQAIAEADAGTEGILHEQVEAWFMAELERRLGARKLGR